MNQTIVPAVFSDYKQRAKTIFDALDVTDATRRDYQYRIGAFADFVISKGFNRNTFLEFKRALASKTDIAVSSKNKYLITAKIFLRELNRQGLLATDMTQNVKIFKQSHAHKVEGLNNDEMKRVVEKLHQLPPTPQTARLKAIVALLALQGLRQIEVVRLDVKDLDLVAKTAMVRGKGQDDLERIDLQPQTVQALQEYLKSNKVADGSLFTSQSNSSKGHRLTTRALQQIVKKIFDELNINRGLHSFRHHFVTTLVSAYKGDLTEVMRYSRHRTLSMLVIYNDNVARKADLPRFYSAFKEVDF